MRRAVVTAAAAAAAATWSTDRRHEYAGAASTITAAAIVATGGLREYGGEADATAASNVLHGVVAAPLTLEGSAATAACNLLLRGKAKWAGESGTTSR